MGDWSLSCRTFQIDSVKSFAWLCQDNLINCCFCSNWIATVNDWDYLQQILDAYWYFYLLFSQTSWLNMTNSWLLQATVIYVIFVVLPGLYKGIHFVVFESTNCPFMKFCTFGTVLSVWVLSAAAAADDFGKLCDTLNRMILVGLNMRIMIPLRWSWFGN